MPSTLGSSGTVLYFIRKNFLPWTGGCRLLMFSNCHDIQPYIFPFSVLYFILQHQQHLSFPNFLWFLLQLNSNLQRFWVWDGLLLAVKIPHLQDVSQKLLLCLNVARFLILLHPPPQVELILVCLCNFPWVLFLHWFSANYWLICFALHTGLWNCFLFFFTLLTFRKWGRESDR